MLALSATYPEFLAQHLTRYMREPTFVRLNPNDIGLKGEFVVFSGKSQLYIFKTYCTDICVLSLN